MLEVNILNTIIQESPSGGSIVSNLTGTSPGSRAHRKNEEQEGSAVTLDEEGLLQAIIAKLTLMDKEGDSDEEGEEVE